MSAMMDLISQALFIVLANVVHKSIDIIAKLPKIRKAALKLILWAIHPPMAGLSDAIG